MCLSTFLMRLLYLVVSINSGSPSTPSPSSYLTYHSPDNAVTCCGVCNFMKGSLQLEDFRENWRDQAAHREGYATAVMDIISGLMDLGLVDDSLEPVFGVAPPVDKGTRFRKSTARGFKELYRH